MKSFPLNGWLYAFSIFFLSFPALPASPIAWRSITEIAVGPGERGPWRQNESRYDYVDDPTVAIDDRGRILVAWVDQARKDVFFRRLAADGRSGGNDPINISRSPATFSWLPRLLPMPGEPEGILVLWQEIIFSGGSHGGDILFARSRDGGATFSAPINLSRSVGGDGKGRITREIWHNGSLDLAADAGGNIHAIWTDYDGALWFSRSSDGGGEFSPPRRLAGDSASPARAPSLAVGPEGSLYAAWSVGEDMAADIRVMKSTDGGISFSGPRIVEKTRGYSDAPKLGVDADGVVHLVFGEGVGGPFAGYQVRYTRSVDGALSFAPSREISQPPTGAGFPAMGMDGKGRLYVLWEIFPESRGRPRGLALSFSADGGRTFTPPAAVPGSQDAEGGGNGSQQGWLMQKLAVNRNGSLAVVNSSLQEGKASRVWLMGGEMPP